MSIKIFIAGTDTDIGKTYISLGLLRQFKQQNYSTLGLKPLASGCCENQEGQLRNEDALALQAAASIYLPYEQINPLVFAPAIAPHIAAQAENRILTVEQLSQKMQAAFNYPADICIIEGVGGWYMPLNPQQTMADFVKANNLAVILVVGMRLGCLNHSILTVQAMMRDDILLAGWLANCIDPNMQKIDENLHMLKKWIKAPFLGLVANNKPAEESINIKLLEPIILETAVKTRR